MNTTVWLISFTDRGEKVQKVHTHNCVADYRLIHPDATVREIDCAAVAKLIAERDALAEWQRKTVPLLSAAKSWMPSRKCAMSIREIDAALANIGGEK